METRSNHILVGSVVLGLLAAVLIFTVWLARLSGGNEKIYDIFFKTSVDGLAKGSAVTFAGVPSGQGCSMSQTSVQFERDWPPSATMTAPLM